MFFEKFKNTLNDNISFTTKDAGKIEEEIRENIEFANATLPLWEHIPAGSVVHVDVKVYLDDKNIIFRDGHKVPVAKLVRTVDEGLVIIVNGIFTTLKHKTQISILYHQAFFIENKIEFTGYFLNTIADDRVARRYGVIEAAKVISLTEKNPLVAAKRLARLGITSTKTEVKQYKEFRKQKRNF